MSDGEAGTSDPFSPDALRARSALLLERYATDDPGIRALTEDAAAALSLLTGRMVPPTPPGAGPFGCALEPVPAPMVPLARRLLVEGMERLLIARPADAEERASLLEDRQSGLASFTAASYSESYFSPGQAGEVRALDGDSETASLLWAFATDCARDGWTRAWAGGPGGDGSEAYAPAFALGEVDWFPDRYI